MGGWANADGVGGGGGGLGNAEVLQVLQLILQKIVKMIIRCTKIIEK